MPARSSLTRVRNHDYFDSAKDDGLKKRRRACPELVIMCIYRKGRAGGAPLRRQVDITFPTESALTFLAWQNGQVGDQREVTMSHSLPIVSLEQIVQELLIAQQTIDRVKPDGLSCLLGSDDWCLRQSIDHEQGVR